MLLLGGFKDNSLKLENLSKLITGKQTELQNTLSESCHYDFGLRNLKHLVNMAASLKCENPDKSELEIVMLSLKKLYN